MAPRRRGALRHYATAGGGPKEGAEGHSRNLSATALYWKLGPSAAITSLRAASSVSNSALDHVDAYNLLPACSRVASNPACMRVVFGGLVHKTNTLPAFYELQLSQRFDIDGV
jgi:hypothetical protein